MIYRFAAFTLFLYAGLATAQSDDLGINKGWGKVRTTNDLCAANPTAAPCVLREMKLDRTMRLNVPHLRVSNEPSSQAVRVQPAPAQVSRLSPVGVKRFASPVALPAGDARWRFFDNGAAVAAGLNLKAWREAGGYGKLVERLKTAGLPGGWDGFLPMVEELDEAWVVLESANRPTQPVVLLRGKFTNPMWRQALSTTRPLTDAQAVLVGEPALVAAVRRRLTMQAAPGKLALEAKTLAQGGDFWLTGIPRLMPQGAAVSGPLSAMMESVQRFSLTMSVRDKLTGDLSLHTSTPAAAAGLLALYRLMELQSAAAISKEWEPLAKALTVESEASTVRFRLALDPDDLAPVLAQRMKAFSPPPPVARGVITIQGLEDGPREIPFDTKP